MSYWLTGFIGYAAGVAIVLAYLRYRRTRERDRKRQEWLRTWYAAVAGVCVEVGRHPAGRVCSQCSEPWYVGMPGSAGRRTRDELAG